LGAAAGEERLADGRRGSGLAGIEPHQDHVAQRIHAPEAIGRGSAGAAKPQQRNIAGHAGSYSRRTPEPAAYEP
jgi:hypothetical protein